MRINNKLENWKFEIKSFLIKSNNASYNLIVDENLEETIDKLTDIGNNISGMKTISNNLKILNKLLFSLLCPSQDKETILEYNFINNCYLNTINSFINDIELEFDAFTEDKLVQLFCKNLSPEIISAYRINLVEFCNSTCTSFNDFIYNIIFSYINVYFKIDDSDYLKYKWDKYLLIAKIHFFKSDTRYSKYYTEQSNSPFVDMENIYADLDTYFCDFLKNLRTPLYGYDNLFFDTLYSPLNVSTNMNCTQDLTNLNDQDALLYFYTTNLNGLLFLCGDPGVGKSISLKMLAKAINEKGNFVFLIELSKLYITSDFNQSLFDYLRIKYPILDTVKKVYSYRDINKMPIFKNVTFIFDEFDESPYIRNSDEINKFINYLLQLSTTNRVILGGRTNMFSFMEKTLNINLSLTNVIQIEPLSRKNAETLLTEYSNFLNTSISIKKIEKIDSEFLKTPLLLFLITWIQSKENLDTKQIYSKADLYELIISATYKRNYTDKLQIPIYSKEFSILKRQSYTSYKDTLKCLGFVSYYKHTREVSISECIEYAKTKEFTGYDYWLNSEDKKQPHNLIIHFFFKTDDTAIYFYHKTFIEYLAQLEILEFLIKYDFRKSNYNMEMFIKICNKGENSSNHLQIDTDFFTELILKLDVSTKKVLMKNIQTIFYQCVSFNLLNSEDGIQKENITILTEIITDFLPKVCVEKISLNYDQLYVASEYFNILQKVTYSNFNLIIGISHEISIINCDLIDSCLFLSGDTNTAKIDICNMNISNSKLIYHNPIHRDSTYYVKAIIRLQDLVLSNSIIEFDYLNKLTFKNASISNNILVKFDIHSNMLYLENQHFSSCDFRNLDILEFKSMNVIYDNCTFSDKDYLLICMENISFINCHIIESNTLKTYNLNYTGSLLKKECNFINAFHHYLL
ncbi:NACHT domain-containing protein [[Clostridium] innocuum]|uniref:NACHT domain-containing protein n=1 Tax=Clostridium innocuum TaxID=1522 RepID=UPI000D6CF319|nr:ATP-binding protein [[Clostridium] innocuum]PWJ12755.1 NACHT domain-containing protein [[Clostridium] innocuum]SSA47121.1 NACHT domain-containing protein [[Clostridium] innocuum]